MPVANAAPSFEELRAAYLARALNVDIRRTLAAVRAWNRMRDSDKRKVRMPAKIDGGAA